MARKWLLEFEAKKSKAITISKKRDVVALPLVMNGEMIPENETLNILGFTIDKRGTWSPHVDRIATEARQRLGAIRRLSHYLDEKSTFTMYKAFVCPRIEYGNVVYWSAPQTSLDKLDRIQ